MGFNDLYFKLLKEAEAPKPPAKGEEDKQQASQQDQGGEQGLPDEGELGDMDEEGMDFDVNEAPVYPEELELAKLAIRALYFNTDSKNVHQFSLKVKNNKIPFEEIPDYFEETKNWQPIIAFVEYVMDKFEGFSSKWTEDPEIKGKNIIDKIKHFNTVTNKDERLDNGKRLYWVRIILNCLLHGEPTENLQIGDVNEQNIKEIFDMLKLHYGFDTRGISPGKNIRAPGLF